MPKTNAVVKLVGEDGNAFAIIGRVKNAIKKSDKPELASEFMTEATSWSQRAGCGCGCSPGFLVNKGFSYGKEIYVDVEGAGLEAAVRNDSEAVAMVNARVMSIGNDPTLTALLTRPADTPRYFGEERKMGAMKNLVIEICEMADDDCSVDLIAAFTGQPVADVEQVLKDYGRGYLFEDEV